MSFQFWFDFASTYSYPAAMRIESLALSHRVDIEWHAFLLGPAFEAQGWNDSPFNIYPPRVAIYGATWSASAIRFRFQSRGLLYFREMVFLRRELRRDSRALRGFQISCVLSISSILQTIWILATLP